MCMATSVTWDKEQWQLSQIMRYSTHYIVQWPKFLNHYIISTKWETAQFTYRLGSWLWKVRALCFSFLTGGRPLSLLPDILPIPLANVNRPRAYNVAQTESLRGMCPGATFSPPPPSPTAMSWILAARIRSLQQRLTSRFRTSPGIVHEGFYLIVFCPSFLVIPQTSYNDRSVTPTTTQFDLSTSSTSHREQSPCLDEETTYNSACCARASDEQGPRPKKTPLF